MKRFFTKLFSRTIIVILLLLVEALLIFAVFTFADAFLKAIAEDKNATIADELVYLGVRIIEYVIAFTIFFKIINKVENPDFKIPWIVLMLILPLFGCFIYLVFGNHGLRKKDRLIMNASNKACRAHFVSDEKEEKQFEKELGNANSAFKYLKSTTGLKPYSGNRVTYYKSGEEFFPEFINCLKQAKEFIFLEFFIIGKGHEWTAILDILKAKAKEGVDIRIIYDDMGCVGILPANTPKKLKKYGIKCFKFHKFTPLLSGIYNNRDHRKIAIIDHQMAFTGGMNLADEYANITHPFKYWKDTMIKIEGSAINNLLALFLQNYNLCEADVEDYNKYLLYKYPTFKDEGYVMPFGDGPGPFDNALIGEQNYINIINYAKKELFISSPYLIPTYSLLDALRNAALRGVKVHLIVPGTPDKKVVYWMAETYFKYLSDAGVNIYRYTPGFNHMKTCIADNELGFVGTINLDFRSLVHHFECGALLYKNPCLKEIHKDFEEMISQSAKVPKNFKVRGIKRPICSLCKIFTPLL